MKTLTRPALVLCACAWLTQSVHAQQIDERTVHGLRPFLGATLGGGSIPHALDPGCSSGFYGNAPALALQLTGGTTFGHVRLETRTSFSGSVAMEDCVLIPPSRPDGVHTYRNPASRYGEVNVTDVRVGYQLGSQTAQVFLSGGPGWEWNRNLPVVVAGAGLRLGKSFRFVLDFDATYYRVPWETTTAEWRNFEIVEVISRQRETKWHVGRLLRAGLEVAPRWAQL